MAHHVLTCLMGVVTVVLVGLIGRRVGGDRVGLTAAGIAALYPILIAADGSLRSEALYTMLVAACMWAALRLVDRPTTLRALVLGAFVGLAALTRTEALILLVLLAVPVVGRSSGPPAPGRRRPGRGRRGDRAVDDPQLERVRPAGLGVHQRRRGVPGRQLRPGLPRAGHRLLVHRVHQADR